MVDELRASLEEAVRFARGKDTGAIVHYVIPSEEKTRRARQILGTPEKKPNAVRRALKKPKSS